MLWNITQNPNMKSRLRLKIQIKLLKILMLLKMFQKVSNQKTMWLLNQRNQKYLFKLRIIQMMFEWGKVKKKPNKTKQKKLKRRNQSS
ncbi:uncharacterized protein LOC103755464 [Manacus vitellinus]|uniref:uncharacterized protein LOC103755464 n=1 Tax=Manacus vitellinus TaxID=328815 RepID=UPI00115DEC81|nr:uncharacterized protein LOC103755464 [Manacus vitellinus]